MWGVLIVWGMLARSLLLPLPSCLCLLCLRAGVAALPLPLPGPGCLPGGGVPDGGGGVVDPQEGEGRFDGECPGDANREEYLLSWAPGDL